MKTLLPTVLIAALTLLNVSHASIAMRVGRYLALGKLTHCKANSSELCLLVAEKSMSEIELKIDPNHWNNLKKAIDLPLKLHGQWDGKVFKLDQAPKIYRPQPIDLAKGSWSKCIPD